MTYRWFGFSLAAAIAILPACSEPGGGLKRSGRDDAQALRVAELSAQARFSVAMTSDTALLALEVRVTRDSVSVTDAQFVRAVLPGGEADQDLMAVGLDGERIAHRYGFADPLEAQEEDPDRGLHRTLRMSAGTVWVYMPAVALDRVEISPARDDPSLPRGGQIDAAALLQRLCAGTAVPACAARALSARAATAPPPPPPSPPPPTPPPPPPPI